MTGFLMRTGYKDRHTRREEHVKTQGETAIYIQAKERGLKTNEPC